MTWPRTVARCHVAPGPRRLQYCNLGLIFFVEVMTINEKIILLLMVSDLNRSDFSRRI